MATDHAASVTVDYSLFFSLPARPTKNNECVATCKLCPKLCSKTKGNNYKYTLTSKGNLLKHLQAAHNDRLESHKEERRKSISNGQATLTGEAQDRRRFKFYNQDPIVTSLALNLCGHGGLPIQICEQSWFRQFVRDIEPRFTPVSRVAVKRKIDELYKRERENLMSEIAAMSCKPSVTIDFWTGCDGRSFMACTIHYTAGGVFKNSMLFFKEVPPPHTAINIRNRFEDELDSCGISAFAVVSDNAANMKSAFTMEIDPAINSENDDLYEGNIDDSTTDDESDIVTDIPELVEYWTEKLPLHFESWIGCAAHQLQLVVHDMYKELLSYRRVQVVFNKAKAICKLSHQSSHFKYALDRRIPVANDTRWNSHY
ncbi:PREDICTED: zinc finger BED domain-containing protein RICESLEEPER 3-like [Amphimedon queenslandica]|uniref:DUF659 domain-containing protein n=1 Tax=Amphimedon queenslandica TaxID=400682 RepID=A0A1X7UN61_AMPQE|nr:PREDICTED: zinc finger BED domain-containing protein RICESLEEPER 3-like [Amphimedon queenslandica]|eukprot:XP_011404500.1 PREDICTED: zinc finger BED domain-containing protein RICESLEEPER 3-like [Amphimedon queenslandica]